MIVVVGFGIMGAIFAYFIVRMQWHNKALMALNDGRLDDAIAQFSKVIKYYPQDSIALYHRANTYKQKGDMDAALADYDSAVARGGRMSGVLYGARAYFLMYLGRYEDALKDYQLALKTDPTQPQTQLGIAYAYLFMKDYEKALAQAQITVDILEKQIATDKQYSAYILANSPEKSAQLESAYISVYATKALALIHLGRSDEAKAIYASLGEKYPNSMVLYVDRAEVNFLLGDYASAIADYEKAIALAQDTLFIPMSGAYDLTYLAQAGYAVSLFASGDEEKAQAQWRDLGKKKPELANVSLLSKEFFWSETMVAQAEKMVASL
ncbi:MAG: tetratricopeptide repeat protein [Phototrophicales bacterium]|nr:tetratricopeptide repeat protein [Phototrophicales bacterium]